MEGIWSRLEGEGERCNVGHAYGRNLMVEDATWGPVYGFETQIFRVQSGPCICTNTH